MKLLERNKGTVKLNVETADDLWYLHTLIDRNDLCSGESEYKYKLGDGREGKAQIVKKRVFVTINVERTEFAKHTGQLRIQGLVTDGSEEVPRGSHHSLDITEGSRLMIAKERWLPFQEEKLEEAFNSAKMNALLLLFDREAAIFALLKPNGHEILLTLKGDVPRKGVDEAKQHTFYKELAQHIGEYAKRFELEHAICASPSFWKEYLDKELSAELKKKVIFTTISTVDETAIKEILLRPELQQALKAQRSARELKIVERILEALAKDKLVYGIADLQAALSEGNLSELTVSENTIIKAREEESFGDLEAIMRQASDIKASVHLLSTADAMQKVDGLGGAVGIKRW
jgi:mRNA surveillance protein pelota